MPGAIIVLECGGAQVAHLLCARVFGDVWMCHRGTFDCDGAFDAAGVAEYVKRREGRHLYLKHDFARDFKEVTNTELTAAHENQLKQSHGVATRRLRVSGYTSGQTYYVGLRPATGEVDAGDESDGFV